MTKNLFSHWTTRFIAALMITLLAAATKPSLPAQARPLEVITAVNANIGTATNKTAGTTLVITTTSAVTAGDDIIVTFAMDNAVGTISVADSAGNTYTSYADVTNANGIRTLIFAAFHVNALPNGSAITITHPNVTARAATASNFRGLAPTGAFDRSSTATGNSANPSSGATPNTAQADELLIGAIGTEGPSGDTVGTWQNLFAAGPRVGTTGMPAASNITISMGYRIVNTTGAYTAAKTGIFWRQWAAAIATFRMDITAPTVTINQAAGQPDPTNASPINFTVVFSERVTGFATGDVSFAGSTAGGALVGAVTEIAPNNGTTYNVAVTGMTSSGTVVASIPAGRATDIGGNNNTASTSTDNTVTYNAGTPPTITSPAPGGGAVNNAYSHTYTATGTTPITFSLSAGSFPPGLSLTPAGLLSGTPTTAGTYTGTVTATNGIAPDATQDFSITISQANTTTTIVSDTPDPSVVGQAVTVNYTVTGQFGNTPTAPTGNVTVTAGADSCIGTVAAGSCSITFTSTGAKTLTAAYAGDANFSGSVSAGVPHQVNQAATTTTITSDAPNPTVVGEAYIVTANVAVTAPGNGTPTGAVTVSDGAQTCTITLPAVSCSLTSTTAGSKTLTATYSGDANFSGSVSAGVPHQVNQAATTTTITNDAPDPSTVGQAVTVNYTVAVTAPGNGTPTGNVTVTDGVDSCTGTVAAGTCTLTLTTPGSRTLTATYAGDANFSGSTSAGETHQVNQISTTTSITSDAPDPSVVGQAVTVTYTVTPAGAGTPTGNVTVSDGVDSCTGTVAAGSCNITLTTAGNRTLTATYAGDTNFSGSTSAGESHTVNQAATTTTITSDAPDPSVVGQAVAVNYTVNVTAPGSGAPTGNVTVTDGVASCTGTVAAGSCNITFTSAGPRTLTASYAGDANFSGSTSAGETHTVNQAATTTAITSDAPDPSLVGQAVTVNYTVNVTAPGSGAPSGNVTVTDGVDSCTGTVAAGSCSLTFTSIGAKTLTASYVGDANFSGSTSAGEPHTVNQAGTTTAITSDAPDPSIVGQAVTVTYTVTPSGAGTPTGDVTVSDGVDSCTGTVAAGSCDITLTTAGNRTLTAAYAGDANFGASTSAGESHTVNASPAFLSADNTTFTVGSISVFTILASGNPAPAISHTSGALPAGIVFTPGVGSATLSGTPAPGTAGVYTLTFLAANGISPDATQTFTLTIAGGPVIVTNGVNTLADTGDGHLDEGETVTVGLTQILVTFNKDVYDPTPDPVPADPDDVTNPANYLLVSDNGDGIQTFTCDLTAPGGGVTGGDTPIAVDSVAYSNNAGVGPFRATLNINGGTPLPDGVYRLIVCGTTSIVDLGGLPLAGNGTLEGTDFTRNFRVAIPGAGGGGGGGGGGRPTGGGLAAGALIPVTGFAPGRVTDLSQLPVTAYHSTGGLTLEIPALKLKMPIVGVPFQNNTWDVNWLLDQAGWLEGSAFPGFDGNSILTGHVTLPFGQEGPFANLHKLKAGDKIFIHAFGALYIYEIKSVKKTAPSDPSILQHEDKAWLTLVTCADYNETVETYLKRLVVKAALVQTQTDLRWYSGR